MKRMTKAEKKKRAAARKKAAREKQLSIHLAAEQSTETKPLPKVTPYPAAGPKVTDFENKLDAHLENDKRPRGRPPKQPVPEPEPAQVPNEIVRQAVQVPFDLWALSQKLKDLKLDEKEAAMLSEPVKTLLDYYLPQLPTIAIAWASLTISAYAVMKPRLEMIAEIKKQKKPAESEQPAESTQPAAGPIRPGRPGQRDTSNFPRQIKLKSL